jgi:hypothetical protein
MGMAKESVFHEDNLSSLPSSDRSIQMLISGNVFLSIKEIDLLDGTATGVI